MTDDELKAIADNINLAAGIAIAGRSVIREMIVDLARLNPDPQHYLTGLYDRVIGHLDPQETLPEKAAVAGARDYVGAWFRDATAALAAGSGAGPRGGASRRRK